MYKLEYQPIARQDMIDIVTYISKVLCNPIAAQRLADRFISEAENIRVCPYAMLVYHPIRPMKYEYRKLPVKNYIMFYRVNEQEKLITVTRVIYAKSDYDQKIE